MSEQILEREVVFYPEVHHKGGVAEDFLEQASTKQNFYL